MIKSLLKECGMNSYGSSSYRLAMLEAKHVEPIHLHGWSLPLPLNTWSW